MTSIELQLRDVNNFLKNKGIALSSNNTWLRSCVECFRTQCTNYTIKELLDFVYEQWLLADLREVQSHTLPKECRTSEKFTLIGKHAVQLNYSIDVGTSSYIQLQKIRKPNFGENLNIETDRDHSDQSYIHKNISNKRSLKLEITDGQLLVIGFEDKPIPRLRVPVPGEKALLKGPIECRKGILMLNDRNIEILGGEVDTLLIPNAVSNVLARLLGQPQDPNPYQRHVENVQTDTDNVISNCFEEDDDDLIMLAESIEHSVASTQPSIQASNSVIESKPSFMSLGGVECLDFEDDDFDLIAAQTASLAELQANNQVRQDNLVRQNNKRTFNSNRVTQQTKLPFQCAKPIAPPCTSTNSPDSVEYIDMNDPKRLKKELEQSYGTNASYRNLSADNATSVKLATKQESAVTENVRHKKLEVKQTELAIPNVSLSSSDSSQEIRSVPTQIATQKRKLPEYGLNNLEDDQSPPWLNQDFEEMDSQPSESEQEIIDNSETFYQPYPPKTFPAVRVIRGQVIRLPEKLSLKDDKWCLSAIVLANGLEIEMTFASEVLDKIFGVTATELIARKKDFKTNPAAKEQINRLLKDSQSTIKNLKCEMVIRFPSVMAKPIIIDVIQK